MIRDFLEQLLLELRVQHYENLRALNALNKTNDMKEACAAAGEISPALIEQLRKFHGKYHTTLLVADCIIGDGATQEEVLEYTRLFLSDATNRRDAEIGHLEALQNVFGEALHFAKLPIGKFPNGNFVEPVLEHNVREIVDEAIAEEIPEYTSLREEFADHDLMRDENLEVFKTAPVILASNELDDEELLLFGEIDQSQYEFEALVIPVDSFRELQFVLAMIKEFKGIPVTSGYAWQDKW